jgi:hypothetical protein
MLIAILNQSTLVSGVSIPDRAQEVFSSASTAERQARKQLTFCARPSLFAVSAAHLNSYCTDLPTTGTCQRLRHGCSSSIVVTNATASASVSSLRRDSSSVAAVIRCKNAA